MRGRFDDKRVALKTLTGLDTHVRATEMSWLQFVGTTSIRTSYVTDQRLQAGSNACRLGRYNHQY